jgi:hypothetical protein
MESTVSAWRENVPANQAIPNGITAGAPAYSLLQVTVPVSRRPWRRHGMIEAKKVLDTPIHPPAQQQHNNNTTTTSETCLS